MPDFVYETVVLDFPKTDLNPLPPGGDPTKHLIASNWNKICQALMDVKTAITNGQYFQLDKLPSIPVGDATSARLRFDSATDELQISINGAAYVNILHTGSSAGGQLGGTLPNPDVRGIRETGGPTLLTIGSIPDGKVLGRSGSNLIGVNGGHVIDNSTTPVATRGALNFTRGLTAVDAGGGPDRIDVQFGASGESIVRSLWAGGRQDNDTTAPMVIGAFSLNPADYTLTSATRTFKFRAVAAPGNNTVTGQVVLFNVTDSLTVATLTFTGSTAQVKQEATLTVPADLPNLEKLYEVRIRVTSHAGMSDLIAVYGCDLRAIHTF